MEKAEQLNMIEGKVPSVCSEPCHTFPQMYCALQKETTAKQSKITLTHTEHRKKYWPLPIEAFQDQCKQTMITKYSNKYN